MNKAVKIIAISILAVTMGSFAQEDEIVKVVGRGIGVDKTEALKDAYRDAIERAVGMYIDAERMVKNGKLFKQILTHSNAYIEKYEIVEDSVKSNGLVELRILAEVRKTALVKKVSDVSPSATASLNTTTLRGFHAKITTQEKRTVDGAAVVENALKDLDPVKQLVKVSLALPEPKIEHSKSNPDVAKLYFLLKFEIDHERYRNEYMPKLRDVLRQVSIETPRIIRVEKHVAQLSQEVMKAGVDEGYLQSESMELFVTFNGGKHSLPSKNIGVSSTVCLITDFSETFSRCKAEMFKLDENAFEKMSKWAKSINDDNGCQTKYVFYNLVFSDNNNEEICMKGVKVMAKRITAGPFSKLSYGLCFGQIDCCVIAPLFYDYYHCSSDIFHTAYYKWVACDVDKDDLPKIASVTIEVAE